MSRAENARGLQAPQNPFGFLVRACHAAFDPAINLGDFRQVDWSSLVALARFHRVEGLCWKALAPRSHDIPHPARESLSAAAGTIAARNLVTVHACAGLAERFREQRVDLLFIKGSTLAVLAYGDIAAKSSADIDLCVAPESIGRAAEILQEEGFALVDPPSAAEARLGRWHHLFRESQWHDRSRDLAIDLHSRLTDNAALIPTIGMGSPRRAVAVTGTTALPTLAADELAAYLAVHGSSSAWFRLKWIADFAALLRREHRGDLPALYESMRKLGAGNAADQALLVADRLFGTLGEAPDLKNRIGADGRSRWLARVALSRLEKADIREPTETRFGTFGINASQWLLGSSPRFYAAESARVGRTLLRRLMF